MQEGGRGELGSGGQTAVQRMIEDGVGGYK